MKKQHRVRVLINRNSGLPMMVGPLQSAIERHWYSSTQDISYQYSHSIEDGRAKTQRAIAEGIDTVLVVGGDGMVHSIGAVLIGTDVALGVIPTGSGNGFARHFGIPLIPEKAVRALVDADRKPIDVGYANKQPFFVTCSMAWDAALVQTFEKSPIRGIIPYVFSAVYEYFGYDPDPFTFIIDDDEEFYVEDPVVVTVANLTQYGGGAQIAPRARSDDGFQELTIIRRRDMPKLVSQLTRLFDGTLEFVPEVITRKFKTMKSIRSSKGPVQMDGEMIGTHKTMQFEVKSRALNVLVPKHRKNKRNAPIY
ncbi:MAG: hypothetical protein EOL87_06275 [Spartobacteria bacterium]|nr:hypothetical protein [Spartobacteria bacterium]